MRCSHRPVKQNQLAGAAADKVEVDGLGWLEWKGVYKPLIFARLLKACQGFTVYHCGSPPSFVYRLSVFVCACFRTKTASVLPVRIKLGKRGKEKKKRRLRLELSKCGSSGLKSLYQCHRRLFFLPSITARWLFPLQHRRKTLTFPPVSQARGLITVFMLLSLPQSLI